VSATTRCTAATSSRRTSTRASPLEHVENYGADIEHRLTGLHETAPWNEFNYGVSDRGASVRIPWQVEIDQKGYIEDRRPNANMDPYVVTRLIVETVCSGEY
jgi:glutamine synthetase